MNIRLENEKDYYEVENLTREAFWNVYRPGCFEHYIIHNLRDKDYFVKDLDYVLTIDDKIIANIVYALGKISYSSGKVKNVLIFGPVSVRPEYQKLGYGEKLINYSMKKAQELGYNEIIITGNPDYYKKYGFESASKYNIYYDGVDENEELPFFMIKIFDKSIFDYEKGIYSEPECYLNIDEKLLDLFDSKFSMKVKEKKEGQLE